MSFPDTPRLTVSPIAEAAQRQALRDLRPPGHPGRSLVLNNLANLLCWRVEQCGDLDPLDEAIDLYRQALDLRPPGHPHRSTSLNQLARALKTRFKRLGDLDSLAETVELHREVLLLSPPEYSTRSTCLANLAIALQAKFEQLGCLDSLTEAVDLHRQALHLRTPEHPGRSESLNNLGAAMELQFEQNGDPALLAEAVELHRQALYLRPLGHRNRSKSLNNLAIAVVTRFNQFGDFDSLAEAAQLHRQALELRPLGHPDHSTSLINLATVVITQFRQLGDLDLLAEAIDLHRQTLDLHPPGHPHRSTSLNNLAAAVTIRFRERGDLGSLEDAVQLYHQALELRPLGHHDRSTSLDNLASAMITRFKKLGNLESLAEAIDLHRQALDLRPQGHPNRSTSLCNLANAVKIRFKQLGDLESLAEAVRLHRQALELRPPGHPERSASLHNLAAVLETRFRHLVDLDNGHAARSLQDGDSDLDEALGLNKEGLELCPDGHPRRMEFLFSIGKCMLRPETHVFDFEKAIRHILEGLQDRTSPAGQTLAFGIYTLPMIEAAYELSTKLYDIFEIGRHYYDDLVLQVYVLVIQLLPRAASFGLDHLDRLNKLSRAETVSRDAATRAIAAGQNAEAVEFLEEGRGVFWSQALRLRATDLDLVSAEDSQELRRLFQLLEHWNIPDESISVVQRERHTEERRRLSSKAEALITDIRSRPGMGRFLLPPAFVSMVQSLPEGFFVFLNVSELGHHALVLDGSAKAPYNIPLKLSARLVGTKHKSPKQNPSQIKAEGKDILENNSKQTTAFSEEEKLRAGGVRERATFEDTLADLWVSIVKPIIDLLQLKVCITVLQSFASLIIIFRSQTVASGPACGGAPRANSPFFLFMLQAATQNQRGSVLAPATNVRQTT
jgi:tetratricopeptide (TPR) repeat protein